MKSYSEAIKHLVRDYKDANDTDFYTYEERMAMTANTKQQMNDVAVQYGKTYREVLSDIRATA